MRGRKIYTDNSPEFSGKKTDKNHQDTIQEVNEADHIKLLETTHQRKAGDGRRERQQAQEATKSGWSGRALPARLKQERRRCWRKSPREENARPPVLRGRSTQRRW